MVSNRSLSDRDLFGKLLKIAWYPDKIKPLTEPVRCKGMKELVEVIAKALVENPDEVVVTESVKDDETVIELSVAPADMGKVIGKQGRIAKAIRSVVKAASSKEDKKVIVEISKQTMKDRWPQAGGSFIAREYCPGTFIRKITYHRKVTGVWKTC